MGDAPTGSFGDRSPPRSRAYSSKPAGISGCFSHWARLFIIFSMTPGTNTGSSNTSTPFSEWKMTTPASVKRSICFLVSSRLLPQRLAIVSRGRGLRSSRASATSAISSVTTQFSTLYSGAFSSSFTSMATEPLIFFASFKMFFRTAIVFLLYRLGSFQASISPSSH